MLPGLIPPSLMPTGEGGCFALRIRSAGCLTDEPCTATVVDVARSHPERDFFFYALGCMDVLLYGFGNYLFLVQMGYHTREYGAAFCAHANVGRIGKTF